VKKIVTLVLFLAAGAAAFSQNLAGLDRWITGFPKGKTDLLNSRITRCVIESTGASVTIDRTGTPVRLNIIKPITLDRLNQRLGLVLNNVANDRILLTDKWNIVMKECEIDFGLKDEMTATLRLSSFRFRLNPETILELIPRLEDDPQFFQQPNDAFAYTLAFKGIDLGTGAKDTFPGWPEYVRRAVKWFQNGLNENNQDMLALVLETKVIKFEEKQTRKRIELAKSDRSNLWVGLNLDYLMPNLILSEHIPGITFNPAYYHVLQPTVYLSWRDLGDPAWLAKPFQFSVALGGFFEFNADYFARKAAGEYVGYQSGMGSFMMAFGPVVGVEFTAMIPKIESNMYAGNLFGVGIELTIAFNLPYFFPDYAYEYFLNTNANLVFHLIPVDGIGLDVIGGFNLALSTEDYDEAIGNIYVSKFGFTIGVRMKLDFFNFYKPGTAPAAATNAPEHPVLSR
jgi:hypothetical protein